METQKIKEDWGPSYETMGHNSHIDGNYAHAHEIKNALMDFRIAVMLMVKDEKDLANLAGATLRITYFLEQLPSLVLTPTWRRIMRKTALEVQREYLTSHFISRP